MHLLNPLYLLTILLFPLFYFMFIRKNHKNSSFLLFENFRSLRETAKSTYLLPRLFDLLAACFLVVALARPVSLDKVVTPPVEGKDIMISLDVSTSMRALDFEPKNRLEAAKTVVEQFVRGRKSDRIGLVFFAKDSFLQVPLTLDYSMFVNLMRKLKTGVIDDGTAIGNGIGLSLSRLDESTAKSRIVILLTDGDNNSGNLSPEGAAGLAKRNNIKIYPILIGTDKEVPYPTTDIFGRKTHRKIKMNINPALLKEIADKTGGKFFQSISTKDLKKAFDEIDKLERSPVPAKKYKLYKEYAPWFIFMAILLIMIGRIFALFFPLYPEVER